MRDSREVQNVIHTVIRHTKTTRIVLDAEMITLEKKDTIMRFLLQEEAFDHTRVLSPSHAELLDYFDERGISCRTIDSEIRTNVHTHILMQLASKKHLQNISFIQLRVLFADFYNEVR